MTIKARDVTLRAAVHARHPPARRQRGVASHRAERVLGAPLAVNAASDPRVDGT